jgi:SNF2 family DNA or RNA helicase
MRKTFLPHQDEALAYARSRSAIGLFLAMRLGKTPVAIRWARKRRLKKVLVVAPLSVLPGMQWEDEIKQETGCVPRIWPNERKASWLKAASSSTAGWYGINYEAVRNQPQILTHDWDGIILDESTRIRNPKAQITKLLLKATDHIEHRCILSGLPNPESPLDLFCQMKFLHGDFLGYENFWAWRQSQFSQIGYQWYPRKGVVEKIKKTIHKQCFIRSQKQVGMGNKKVFERRYVYMTPAQKKLQREIERDFTAGDHSTKWAPVQQTWLARLAGGFAPGPQLLADNKLKLLKQILTEEMPTEQVVVWFRFTAEIKAAYEMLKKAKVSCKIIRGKTDKKKRPIIQRKFHAGSYRVLLMQVKVGQYGLNLACANTAIYYSNAWDHEIRSQSQQRIEHMMKKVPLLYIDLVTKGSVDEAVLDALQTKKHNSRQFLRDVMDGFLRRAA